MQKTHIDKLVHDKSGARLSPSSVANPIKSLKRTRTKKQVVSKASDTPEFTEDLSWSNSSARKALLGRISVTFHVGEQRRFFGMGWLFEIAVKAFVVVPISLKEIGGGPDLLRGHPARKRPLDLPPLGSLDDAGQALSKWAEAFIEEEAPPL